MLTQRSTEHSTRRVSLLSLGFAGALCVMINTATANENNENGESEAPCIKQVFNQYCLGSPLPQVQIDTLEALDEQRYQTPDGLIKLTLSDNTLSQVTRQIPPGQYINFNQWRSRLVGLYGKAQDHSDMPASARSRSSRYNAIRSGLGYMRASWPQAAFAVELSWQNTDAIELSYTLRSPEPPPESIEGL